MENVNTRKAVAFRLGLQAFGGLMALTIFEFWIASMAKGPIPYPVLFWPLAPVTWLALSASANPMPYLVLIAAIKAVLILRFFMHISQIWQAEGDH
ncbi:MAG: hypothetical protein GY832_12305 [Chloroflexi bacterium]|nr:hypothetical protein [Chloroflexota bacterium]